MSIGPEGEIFNHAMLSEEAKKFILQTLTFNIQNGTKDFCDMMDALVQSESFANAITYVLNSSIGIQFRLNTTTHTYEIYFERKYR